MKNNEPGAAHQSLRLVSYNILADAYVLAKRYPDSLPEDLEPTARLGRLLETLTHLNADILCLQEVEPSKAKAILAHLGGEFAVRYDQRAGHPDGCAIVYRKERAVHEQTEVIHYEASEANFDHIAQVSRFAVAGLSLGIANTHLRWQPRDKPIDQHVGRLQMHELLEHVSGLKELPSWVIAGDFNAISESPVVREAIQIGFRLGCRSQRPWDTTNIGRSCRKIDYLLYRGDNLVPEPGTLPKLERQTPMPSASYASDHLPVMVDFTLNSAGGAK